jgi:hypothetical protein
VTSVRPGEAERGPGVDRIDRLAAAVDRGSEGLPVGVQIVARPWADERVVALMRAVEAGVAGDEGRPRSPVDPAPGALKAPSPRRVGNARNDAGT